MTHSGTRRSALGAPCYDKFFVAILSLLLFINIVPLAASFNYDATGLFEGDTIGAGLRNISASNDTLSGLIQSANLFANNSGLVGQLSTSLFAPSDAAWTLFNFANSSSVFPPEFLIANGTVSPSALLPGSLIASQLRLASLGNNTQYLSVGGNAAITTIGNALVDTVYNASNGFVYRLSGVPAIPQDVFTVLQGIPSFSRFVALVNTSASLRSLISLPASTLFIPTDTAFGLLPQPLQAFLASGTNASISALQQIIRNHMIYNASAPAVLYRHTLYNMMGSNMGTIKLTMNSNTTYTVSNITNNTVASVAFIDSARITAFNTLTSSGVVHTIDSVLLPFGYGNGLGYSFASTNSTIFYKAIVAAGLLDTLSNCNCTVFAPPDSYFDIRDVPGQTPGNILLPTGDSSTMDPGFAVLNTTHGTAAAHSYAAENVNMTGYYKELEGPYYYPYWFFQDFYAFTNGSKNFTDNQRALLRSFLYTHIVPTRIVNASLTNGTIFATLSGANVIVRLMNTNSSQPYWNVNLYPRFGQDWGAMSLGQFATYPVATTDSNTTSNTTSSGANYDFNGPYIYHLNTTLITHSNSALSARAGDIIEIVVICMSILVFVIGICGLIYFYNVHRKTRAEYLNAPGAKLKDMYADEEYGRGREYSRERDRDRDRYGQRDYGSSGSYSRDRGRDVERDYYDRNRDGSYGDRDRDRGYSGERDRERMLSPRDATRGREPSPRGDRDRSRDYSPRRETDRSRLSRDVSRDRGSVYENREREGATGSPIIDRERYDYELAESPRHKGPRTPRRTG